MGGTDKPNLPPNPSGLGEPEWVDEGNPDLRVTVKLGVTLKVEDYTMIRADIELTDLNPAGDVGAQVSAGLASASTAYAQINEQLPESLEAMVEGMRVSDPHGVARLDAHGKEIAAVRETLNKLIVRLREASIAEELAEKVEKPKSRPGPQKLSSVDAE